ncbi:hypothetical protein [Flectobacillus sp. BAB-3569]|uniref:hypothetical protein n=1 Tax=Flectobacillus sp. BAB-3569 TaxID=1509483 RepID=UPI000BA40FEE|nr:hypothetical protein [Flectobacillus sp. BAB-3569]PAC33288.1 hypothetical protein BWI92_01930 [Flectobacillus sp. BAB-3569]
MKKALIVIGSIILGGVIYFVGKSKRWWTRSIVKTKDSSNGSATVNNPMIKLSSKLSSLGLNSNSNIEVKNPNVNTSPSPNNSSIVDTSIVRIFWNGQNVYAKKGGKYAYELVEYGFGFLQDGTIVYQYPKDGIWIFSTSPYLSSINEYGVDTNSAYDSWYGISIYRLRPQGSSSDPFVIGYLYDGTSVFERWDNEGTPDERKVYYW